MQVLWQEFLKAVNNRACDGSEADLHHCPVHTKYVNTWRTLQVSINSLTGEPYFICRHPRCKFRGTAVSMVQRIHDLKSFEDAVDMFKPGNKYAHTMPPNTPPDYFNEYIVKNNSEVRMQTFLAKCYRAIEVRNEGLQIKGIMDNQGCKLIPSGVGLYIPGENKDVPPTFRSRWLKTNYVVYPYTYNGKLNSIRFQPVKDIPDWTTPDSYLMTTLDAGVFLENTIIPATTEAYVVTSALGACVVQSKCRTHTLEPVPVVSVTGFPLPLTFKHLKQITLILFKQAPLTLQTALELYSQPVIEDQTNKPVRVIDLGINALDLPINLYSKLQNNAYHSTTLLDWIINVMRRLDNTKQLDAVTAALERLTLTDIRKSELVFKAMEHKLSPGLIGIIKANGELAVSYNRITLANQRIVGLAEANMKAIQPNGDDAVLCNFSITVTAKTQLENKIGYKCLISLEGKTFQAGIHEDELKSATTLHSAINKAMIEAGINGYVAVYQIKNYEWRDILAKLAQDVPLSINA